MSRPKGYTEVPAHKESIQQARETKESLGLTWNEFLETAARQLDSDNSSD